MHSQIVQARCGIDLTSKVGFLLRTSELRDYLG